MKRSILLLSTLTLLLLISASLASARLAGYKLAWWTVDNGGGASSSASYKLKGAIGQPDADVLSSSSFKLKGGFWGFEGLEGAAPPSPLLYLPLNLKNFRHPHTPPCDATNGYCEPNNSTQTAFGPLLSGVSYQAYPDDNDDYYYFYLNAPATVTISVAHYQDSNPLADGQLLLKDAQFNTIAGDPSSEDHEMTIGPIDLQTASKYYVYLYSVTHDPSNLYTFSVTLSYSH